MLYCALLMLYMHAIVLLLFAGLLTHQDALTCGVVWCVVCALCALL